MRRNRMLTWTLLLVMVLTALSGCSLKRPRAYSDSLQQLPIFSSDAYTVINDNQPEFTDDQLVTESYEFYSELDSLNRCGYAMACIGRDIMPSAERGSIGQIKPSGWHTVKYDIVDGKYLYNRCHLIGFQLTGENANERNLITGTRYMNVEGMLPFENMIADYVKETGNHVIYRVTPVFQGDELLARGVQLEAWSVEDGGEGICFNVYVYNNQPGVIINYADGTSKLENPEEKIAEQEEQTEYVLNKKSKKFHTEDCSQVDTIASENRQHITTTRSSLLDQGYEPAGCCEP